MQCSRCNSVGSAEWQSRKRSRKGLYDPTPTSNGFTNTPLSTVPNDSIDFASPHPDRPPRRLEFFHQYSGSLIICGVTGAFCAAALFFLTFSVLQLGVAAFYFLSIFVLGLFMSIGLPFKMYKEYLVLSAGVF